MFKATIIVLLLIMSTFSQYSNKTIGYGNTLKVSNKIVALEKGLDNVLKGLYNQIGIQINITLDLEVLKDTVTMIVKIDLDKQTDKSLAMVFAKGMGDEMCKELFNAHIVGPNQAFLKLWRNIIKAKNQSLPNKDFLPTDIKFVIYSLPRKKVIRTISLNKVYNDDYSDTEFKR